MKVILTEKPSVARDIAKCLRITQKHDGYFQGNGYQITWAFGHLIELKQPEDYDKNWKRWTLAALPMLPAEFGLKAKADASAQKQLNTIKQLLRAAAEIICATDAGREGELIFRYILAWSGCGQKPFKRLWISSLTDEAIRQGFARLQEGQVFDGLYRAAKCRSESDWIVGLNATRLYTLKFGQQGGLWTLGRVQTPLLALLVQKDLEISAFIAKDYWELHSLYREADFQYVGGRFEHKPTAEQLLKQVIGQDFKITSVKGKRELQHPPLLYDLTDLQKDMHIRYGLTAEQTLACAQQLYEKKVLTYPRTDSRYLTKDMQAQMRPLLEKLGAKYADYIHALNLEKLSLSNRIFNDAKVSDHHAIIPTTMLPGGLSDQEAKVYQAVAKRFIAAFYPPCVKQITTVLGEVPVAELPPIEFKASGAIIAALGWQALFKNEAATQAENELKILPQFVVGESGPQLPALIQGKTTPPKPYNEASLLSMMESAGKTCDDEELKEALKEKGLGTPATRAAMIEVLIKRNYIQRQKKALVSTEAGRHLISLISDERLKSVALTGDWEAKLKKIERNAYDPVQFMAEIAEFTRQIIDQAGQRDHDASRLGDCPFCRQPVIEGKKGFGCSAWKSGCQFVLWKQTYGVVITQAMASELLQNSRTRNSYALKLDEQVFKAQLTLNAQGETGYCKLETGLQAAIPEAIADCPLCNGKIIETSKAYGCSEWRNGCKFVIWKTIAHKKISVAMVKKLLSKGETGVLTGFKSSKGVAFAAKLKLVAGKVELAFSEQAASHE